MIAVRPIAALLCLFLSAPPASAEQSFADLILAGRKLYDEGKVEEASARFAEAAKREPADWRGHFWLCACALQRALHDEDPRRRADLLSEAEGHAASLCKPPANFYFTHPLPKYLQGLIASMRGDRMGAYGALNKAIRARPETYREFDEIGLQRMAERAFARSAIDLGKQMLVTGNFMNALNLLEQGGTYVPADDRQGQADLARHLAAAQEGLSRFDDAIRNLRRAIELEKEDEEVRFELTASIAMIHLRNEKLEEGTKVLGELPPDCRNIDVVWARSYAKRMEALRDPEGPAMEEALRNYLDLIPRFAKEDQYRFVVDYGETLLRRIGAVLRDADRPAVAPQIERLLEQATLHPECPPVYWQLKQFYKLLGDGEKELYYQRIHDEKRKEIEKKERYDPYGRPRC